MQNIDHPRRTQLAPDYSISRVIKGGWQLSAGHTVGKLVDRDRAVEDTLAFIRGGITTLDFGDIYTGVEEIVGASLQKLSDEIGVQARNDVQLHTKYVPDIHCLEKHRFADAARIIHRSRQRLGVDTLDLVQFHWWDYAIEGYIEALQHLVELQRQGYIRLLGVTNFDVPRMQEFVEAGVIPSTIQLQYSLLDRRPENGMIDFCKQNDVRLLCYGTVAGGFLSEKYIGAPEPVEPFENRSLIKYKLIIDEFGGWDQFQNLLGCLQSIAQKHQCSIATVASAYVLTRPQVAAVIVGARDASHLAQNTQIMNLKLDTDDFCSIERILDDTKGPAGDVYHLERYNVKHTSIMQKTNNAQ